MNIVRRSMPSAFIQCRMYSSGGGKDGAIKEAGGSFAKRQSAQEEQYMLKQQREQMEKLKLDLKDEISFHEEQIKRHQDAINRHKQRVTGLDKQK